MKYDFTTQVSRENTGSSKWDGMYAANPNVPEGTVPFSVADMEFKNPPQIAEGIGEYLKNSIMGYCRSCRRYAGGPRQDQDRSVRQSVHTCLRLLYRIAEVKA